MTQRQHQTTTRYPRFFVTHGHTIARITMFTRDTFDVHDVQQYDVVFEEL